MKQRPFGGSGSSVPVIGQGTWFIERGRRASAVSALQRGLELGMTHIDTAEMYGMGAAEEIVGEAIEGRRNELDVSRLGEEVLTVVERLAEDHPEMGALVIECTDLPPFARLIQEKIRVPVFDIVTLTNMIYETLMRTPYQGILPRRVLVE